MKRKSIVLTANYKKLPKYADIDDLHVQRVKELVDNTLS